MRCSLRIKSSESKALAALPKADRVRVVEAIDLGQAPAPGSPASSSTSLFGLKSDYDRDPSCYRSSGCY